MTSTNMSMRRVAGAGRFTPVQVVDQANESEWAAKLNTLDWEETSIVFTKRQLVDFLQSTGLTVDPDCSNIAQLPRYAQFGKITAATTSQSGPIQATTSSSPGGSGASTPVTETPLSSSGPQPVAIPGGARPVRRARLSSGGTPHTLPAVHTLSLFGEDTADVPTPVGSPLVSSPFREAVRPPPPSTSAYPPPDTTQAPSDSEEERVEVQHQHQHQHQYQHQHQHQHQQQPQTPTRSSPRVGGQPEGSNRSYSPIEINLGARPRESGSQAPPRAREHGHRP